MVIVWALSWWYAAGWKAYGLSLLRGITRSVEYFSFASSIKNLFAPYRQISAYAVRGSLDVRWRAFVDRTISRVIGAIVRSGTMVIGGVWIMMQVIGGAVFFVAWPLVPFFPVVCVVLAAVGLAL